ncbi:hypothetical protein Ocin01_04520 [Orchesella cincta]|uniref:Multidrug resistance-associated protein 4 n=1 Tax=Orchesella cincta TaxID=48709 RepID=A0A1D2NA83_ORCCI|nr:hypothetical protein Ocin01_04520 [Orchesella cincta]
MEDMFTLDDDDVDNDEDSIIVQQGIVTDLVHPNNLRHRGSIQFEIDERANLKRVSMAPATDKIRLSRAEVPVTEMALLVHDDEASDSKDKILAPKKISLTLYYEFLHTGSSRKMLIFVLIFCVISQVLYTLTDLFIEHWAHAEEVRRAHPTTPVSPYDTTQFSIILYSVLLASIVTFSFGRSMLIFRICTRASTCIFTKLLNATIESRMHFFEKTCAGHAINRLSKDMSIIDDLLPPTFMELVGVIFEILGALSILAFANFWFTIPALAFIFANLVVYRMYHLTAADLKRIEGNARSPIYSHLSRTLQGVSTIRAFGQEQAFIMIFDRLQDNHTASWNLFISAQSWLGVIVDCVSLVLIGMICLSFFYLDTNPAAVGLTISKMIELSILVQFAVGEMSNTETQMISVERVLEYAHPQEKGQFEIFDGPAPPIEWPTEGKIEMTALRMTPRDAGINLTIEAGQKIGIVGRAGSGKTRLLNALFRITEPYAGSIKIDGIDLKNIGLQNLRGHISIIPQTPCMFAGTVRQNMDPFNNHTDDEIWDALNDCVMSDAITRMGNKGNGLNAIVQEYGSNFSAGQRQFICLARAILAKKKILLCDEPTASLDGLSSIIMIQNIKNRFANSTVLLVAHRISSVMYCDKLVVMEGGDIVDQGPPLELLQKKNGPFYDMVKQLGQKTMDELIELAKDQQQERIDKKTRKSTTIGMLPSTGLGLSHALGNLRHSKI